MPAFATSTDQRFTDTLPRIDDKKFYMARQTAANAAATTGFQPLHYLTYEATRTQPVNAVDEYGLGLNVDATDPEFGEVELPPASETHRLCLNEEFYRLVPLLGAPVTSDQGDGLFQHTFNSGKSILPTMTIQDTDSQSTRKIWGAAAANYALNIGRAGGIQNVSMSFLPLGFSLGPAEVLDAAAIRPVVPRILVPQSGFSVIVNGTNLGRALDINLNYATDLQSERYVGGGSGPNAIYVGNPSCSVGFSVRYTGETQRAVLGGPDQPLNVAIVGTGVDGSLIRIAMDRVFGDAVFPTADNKMQRLTFSGQAARRISPADASMMRVILRNTVNPED